MDKYELVRLCLFLVILMRVKGAVITVHPQSASVPIYTTVVYTCEGTGDVLNWLVEGVTLEANVKQERYITVIDNHKGSNLSSVLIVTALPTNDGLRIACQTIVISDMNFDQMFSQQKTLTIKGQFLELLQLLTKQIYYTLGISSVENLICNFISNNSAEVAWLPPVYYSNDVPVDSPVSHQVLVTNEDGDAIVDTNTTNINITVYNITECDTFNISVTALVDQYESIDNTISNNGSYVVSLMNSSIQDLLLEILSAPSPHCECTLIVKDNGAVLINEYINSSNRIIEYSLTPFKHYQLAVMLINLRGKIEDNFYTTISTYNVQDVLVSTEGNGSVSVQCVFVSGSTADGCHVIFTDTSNGRNEYFNITGLTLVTLPAGNYTVTAYDIINGAFYGPAVHPILIAVIASTPSLSSIVSFTTDVSTAFSEAQMYSSTMPVNHPTIDASQKSSLLLTICLSVIGGVSIILIIALLIAIASTWWFKKRQKETAGLITNNPAYGQVSCLLRQRLTLLLMILLPSLLELAEASHARITAPPVSVLVLPPYAIGTLKCEGNGAHLFWQIVTASGYIIQMSPDIKQQRNISVITTNESGNLSSVFTIVALPVNDGIKIKCQIVSYPPLKQVFSNSTLTISGISPVEIFTFNFTSNASLISWSPPVYYSNDVPAGSPVSYQVLVTDEEDGDIILNTTTINTNITVPNVTECDAFNISVTALVGRFSSTNTEIGHEGSGYYVVNITTVKYNSLTSNVSTNVSIELSCPPSQSNTSLTITSGSKVIDQYLITGTDKVFNDARTLELCKKYKYAVSVFNKRNELKREAFASISTYQVSDVYINNTYTNGSVSVQCIYEELSTADGCHVIFTDTRNGRNEYFNITGLDHAILSLSTSGTYRVTAHNIFNGYITPWTCVKPKQVNVTITPSIISTTNSVDSMSSTINDVLTSPLPSPTDFIEGTDDSSSPGSETGSNSILFIISGVIGACLLVIIVIFIVAALLLMYKRQAKKKGVILTSEIAICHQPQAEMSHYQEIPIGTVSIDVSNDERSSGPTSEPVQGNIVDPYHVSSDELLAIRNGQTQTSSPSSSSDSIGSPFSATPLIQHDDENTFNTGPTVTVTNNTATYAVIGRRTDTTDVPLPTDQCVEYSNVAGDISKRGVANAYNRDNHNESNTNNTIHGDFNPAIAAEISPPPYDDLDTITNPVIGPIPESVTVPLQALPVDYLYPQAEEESHIKGASSLFVTSPVEQPKDGYDDHSSSRLLEYFFVEFTPLPVWTFSHQPHEDNNVNAASTQDEEKTLLYHDLFDDLDVTPLENLDREEEFGHSDVMLVPHFTSQYFSKGEEERNFGVKSHGKEENEEVKNGENIDELYNTTEVQKGNGHVALPIMTPLKKRNEEPKKAFRQASMEILIVGDSGTGKKSSPCNTLIGEYVHPTGLFAGSYGIGVSTILPCFCPKIEIKKILDSSCHFLFDMSLQPDDYYYDFDFDCYIKAMTKKFFMKAFNDTLTDDSRNKIITLSECCYRWKKWDKRTACIWPNWDYNIPWNLKILSHERSVNATNASAYVPPIGCEEMKTCDGCYYYEEKCLKETKENTYFGGWNWKTASITKLQELISNVGILLY
uniref:Fibronectin type-III domain-containing protein n=1 Tax=Amphimedon queenslandica TaxID=400682 RepID=A0A1X7TZK5_AMPQE